MTILLTSTDTAMRIGRCMLEEIVVALILVGLALSLVEMGYDNVRDGREEGR